MGNAHCKDYEAASYNAAFVFVKIRRSNRRHKTMQQKSGK